MKTLILVISMLAMPVIAANTNKSTDVISELRPTISKVAKENGIDPVLMEAIMRHESGHGKSNAARNKNNLAGIMRKRGEQRVYPSKEACVKDLGSILAKYKASGRKTTAQIGKKYCTTGEWALKVDTHMKAIRSGRHGDISIYGKK